MKINASVRLERLKLSNRSLEIIASHGRRFFSTQSDRPTYGGPERISRFEIGRAGRLWFIDKYTEKPIYVAYRRGDWRGFSDGGTLRSLVCAMADWIGGKRSDFPLEHLGPWPTWVCQGDLWGYGDDMHKVREEIKVILSGQRG